MLFLISADEGWLPLVWLGCDESEDEDEEEEKGLKDDMFAVRMAPIGA